MEKRMVELSQCQEHGRERALYCSNSSCEDYLCDQCMAAHRQHDVLPAISTKPKHQERLRQRLEELATITQKLTNIRTAVQAALASLHTKRDEGKMAQHRTEVFFAQVVRVSETTEAAAFQKLLRKVDSLSQHAGLIESEVNTTISTHKDYDQQLGTSEDPRVAQLIKTRDLLRTRYPFVEGLRALDIEHAQLERSLEEERQRPISWHVELDKLVLPNAQKIFAELQELHNKVTVLTERLNEKDKQIADLTNILQTKCSQQEMADLVTVVAAKATDQQVAQLEKAMNEAKTRQQQEIANINGALGTKSTPQQVTDLLAAMKAELQHQMDELRNVVRGLPTNGQLTNLHEMMSRYNEVREREIATIAENMTTLASKQEVVDLRTEMKNSNARWEKEIKMLNTRLAPLTEYPPR